MDDCPYCGNKRKERNYIQEWSFLNRVVNALRHDKDSRREIIDIRREIVSSLIENKHPVKIGDRMRVTRGVNRGKDIVVDSLNAHIGNGDKLIWIAGGRIINKDGAAGKRYGEWMS